MWWAPPGGAELEFKRPKGFAGSLPRKWIDSHLPVCPFCGGRPAWEMAMQFKLGLNRYHFRCRLCRGTLSIPVASISYAAGGLGGMIIAAGASKDLMVESVGASRSALRVGSEYAVAALRAGTPRPSQPEIIERSITPSPPPPQPARAVYVCPNCDGEVSEHDAECPHCHTALEDA